MTSETGKLIVLIGISILLIGVIIYFFHNNLHWIGNLPGDIKIERGNFRFYFPFTTMIIITIIINVVIRIFKWFN